MRRERKVCSTKRHQCSLDGNFAETEISLDWINGIFVSVLLWAFSTVFYLLCFLFCSFGKAPALLCCCWEIFCPQSRPPFLISGWKYRLFFWFYTFFFLSFFICQFFDNSVGFLLFTYENPPFSRRTDMYVVDNVEQQRRVDARARESEPLAIIKRYVTMWVYFLVVDFFN